MSSKIITSKLDRDGGFSRLTDAGWVKETERPQFGPNFPGPDEEPVYDPENLPSTPEQLKQRKRISPAKFIRQKLGFSQEEFAETYMIPIGTLRDWEQHRSEPDAPARAYLKVIAADPERAAAVLKASARPAAE